MDPAVATGYRLRAGVTNGDPLEIQTQVKHVYVAGKEVDLSNKQTRLYERYLGRQ